MRTEIGGYIELDEFTGAAYYPGLLALNSARNAVVYLIKARGINKICLPCFLCGCVLKVCRENGCEVVFYHIERDLKPDSAFTPPQGAWVYLVNYYGQLSDAEILAYKERYPRLIVDHVQAFFQAPLPGVDTVYTCRKFFGVPDGAYLSTDARLDGALETDCSSGRVKHLLGRFEGSASDYYGAYRAAEEEHDTLPLRAMSKLTRNILRAIDYDAVKSKRNENWATLADALAPVNRLLLRTPDAPFMYPLSIENGGALRAGLAEKRIFIPTLWPDVAEVDSNALERDMARNILPLPVDQRYGSEDMRRLIAALAESPLVKELS